MRCLWCANPESQQFQRSIMYRSTRCIGCGKCVSACPQGAIAFTDTIAVDDKRCVCCGRCSSRCNADALTVVGEAMDTALILEAIERDREFYATSGGGVTFSGGEPLAHANMLLTLSQEIQARGYHTCVETSGYAPWSVIESLLPFLDLFLFDFKCMDAKRHLAYVGVENQMILDNYVRLVQAGKPVVARMPVIPGINDTPEQLECMVDFLQEHSAGCDVHLLPYHRLGVGKYSRMGLPYDLEELEPPTPERMEQLRQTFQGHGFCVTIGG